MTRILLPLQLLLLTHSISVIQTTHAWTSKFSFGHNSSSGRFFHPHNNSMKSLRATRKDESDDIDDTPDSDSQTNKEKKRKRTSSERTRSKLEHLYNMDDTSTISSSLLESFTDEYNNNDASSPGQSLLQGEKNDVIVLGDWMEWEEGGISSCVGDHCGGDDFEQCDIPEEYKQYEGAPKVDVMSFLGIKRAQPIQVQRDWD